MKASAVKIGSKWVPIGKDPVTDSSKKQKKGRLTLRQNEEGAWYTSTDITSWQDKELLQTVFEDGEIRRYPTLKEIRERANSEYKGLVKG